MATELNISEIHDKYLAELTVRCTVRCDEYHAHGPDCCEGSPEAIIIVKLCDKLMFLNSQIKGLMNDF